MKHALSDATCTAGATTLPLTTKGLMRYASLTTLGSLCLPLSTSSTSVSAAAFVIAPKVILRRDLFPNTEHQLGEHRRCCRRGGGRNYCRRHRCCRKSLFTRRIGRGDHFVHAKDINSVATQAFLEVSNALAGGRAGVRPPVTVTATGPGGGFGSGRGGDSISVRERRARGSPTMLGAWRCSGTTNAELLKNMMDAQLVRSTRVAQAMQATDRGFYTPQDPYEDRPQPIGFRATISAPHMHAHALEVLSPVIPTEKGRVLDVGCGSGYLTGALSRLVGVGGVVYGMDYIQELVNMSEANLNQDDDDLLASGRVSLKTGDGWKGWAEKGPFDAIHVGAAAETIPEDLVSQLKVGGRMVVPVGPQSSSQMLVQVDRTTDDGPISEAYTTEDLMAVVYVPLVSNA